MTVIGQDPVAGAAAASSNGAGARSTARLACTGVTVRFGGLVAVNDASLTLHDGEVLGLVGPNGAGKSTLFGVLSGLLRPTTGQVFMDGDDVTGTSPQERSARGLARTFQHPEIFTGLTVSEHLLLARRAKSDRRRMWADLLTLRGLRRTGADEQAFVDELVELVGLTRVADHPAVGLPLGVARLVELGRALASSPRVLLLDEPSSGLDSTETEAFETTICKVVDEKGTSVLIVEHDVELVMRMSDQVNVLDFGTMIASGPPAVVQADPKVRAAYLGEDVKDIDAQPASRGRPAATPTAAGSTAGAAAPVLEVNDLCVRYGDAMALDGVSFSVAQGRVLALLGPNGAGKSSVARAVSGLVCPSGGHIRLDGEQVGGTSAHGLRRSGVVYLPEGRGVFRSLSVHENLRMAAATLPTRQERNDAVAKAMEIFPILAERRTQAAGLLSGGEQQMLSIARALACSPTLVIADEMSLGLAPLMVDLVFDSLQKAKDLGATIVIIEQYVHRALAFADDCVVLQRGKVAWQGSAAEVGDDVLRHYLGDAVGATS